MRVAFSEGKLQRGWRINDMDLLHELPGRGVARPPPWIFRELILKHAGRDQVDMIEWPTRASSVGAAMQFITPKQAAVSAGVSLSLVYQWCEERRLPHYRLGGGGRRGGIRIDEKDLAKFLAGCRVEAGPEDCTLRHIR
jgi:excisionase family DNA binding protein